MEKWKTCFENYEISTKGNIKNTKTNRILKTRVNKRGYLKTNIMVDGKLKTVFPHRLVAIAFIENKENKEQVNHIDGNKTNNSVNNLEWVTGTENSRHAVKTGLIKTKKVKQFNLKNEFICEYNSIKEACEKNNLKANGIYAVCIGYKKTSQGYKWTYS